MDTIIESFTGENAFMSSSYVAPIRIGYITYVCVESAYQAFRIEDTSLRGMFAHMHAKEAKAVGRLVQPRDDWDNVKHEILYQLTLEKFKQNNALAMKLLQTGDTEIREENLGHILMSIRNDFKKVASVYMMQLQL